MNPNGDENFLGVPTLQAIDLFSMYDLNLLLALGALLIASLVILRGLRKLKHEDNTN